MEGRNSTHKLKSETVFRTQYPDPTALETLNIHLFPKLFYIFIEKYSGDLNHSFKYTTLENIKLKGLQLHFNIQKKCTSMLNDITHQS